jgi:hypothetical protein
MSRSLRLRRPSLSERALGFAAYHQADWRKVAALSVAVLARMQEGQRRGKALKAIASRFQLSDLDQLELLCLFADPIHWGFGAAGLDNGQHRVCALKKAGAELCVVERYTSTLVGSSSTGQRPNCSGSS